MAEQQIDDPLFDYRLYRFGRSKQTFRGPEPQQLSDHVSFVGSVGTFGRYVDKPFATMLGERLGAQTLNLGAMGAGPGLFLADPELMRVMSEGRVCVVQAMSAAAVSNRMFSVKPRRNARLKEVSDLMKGIFPDVEFDKFSYVMGMLRHLRDLDETRFLLVTNEMRNAWIGRTRSLLRAIERPKVLFWFSQRTPGGETSEMGEAVNDPHFVDQAMIDAVREEADAYVECVVSVGLPQDLTVDGKTVLFKPSGVAINENREFPSPEMHQAAADALEPVVRELLDKSRAEAPVPTI